MDTEDNEIRTYQLDTRVTRFHSATSALEQYGGSKWYHSDNY